MTKLSVNINKIATLRNSRGGDLPSVTDAAMNAERFGAQGITVHPRPDQRHITYRDVYDLKKIVATEFNIEGNPTDSFTELVLEVVPTQVTLVPDAPDALTSNNGWDTKKHLRFLREKVDLFHSRGIRVSIFLNPDPELVPYALETGTDRIELYTEAYAAGYAATVGKACGYFPIGHAAGQATGQAAGHTMTGHAVERAIGAELYEAAREAAIAPYVATAVEADRLGLGINAGHDLNLDNLRYFARAIPSLMEVSIGHALISDSIYLGFENTIQLYLRELASK